MTWREAFLAQARSDHRMLEHLEKANVEFCHRLHYLQMATEKLARSVLADPNDPKPPPKTHIAFIRMLQVLKGQRWVWKRLGYQDHQVFSNVVNSLLDTARAVEDLVPSEAGYYRRNPEYPWQDPSTKAINAPCDFEFPTFNPRSPRFVKLRAIVRGLLRIEL